MPYPQTGFAVLPAVFPQEAISLLREAVGDLCLRYRNDDPAVVANAVSLSALTQAKPQRNPGVSPADAAGQAFIIGDLLALDRRFLDFVQDARLWAIAADCLEIGEDRVVFHFSNVTRKPPLTGPSIAWHRDYANTYFCPVEPDFVRLLVPLQAMSLENGGTGVVPGSHREGDRRARCKLSADVPVDAVFPALEAGDVLAIHPKVVHGGPPNRGTGQRDLLVFQFGKKDAPLRFEAKEHLSLVTRGELLDNP